MAGKPGAVRGLVRLLVADVSAPPSATQNEMVWGKDP